MSNNIAVQTRNLVKTFAGKTTVFKILLGLLQPTMGEATVLGMDSRKNSLDILKRTGSLIETPIFYEHLSAFDNLKLHLAYMGTPNADIDGTLKLVGLAGVGTGAVSTFSLGMRQRLAIARALVNFFVMGTALVGLPYIVRTVLGLNAEYYGVAESILGVAAILGSIVAGLLTSKMKIGKLSAVLAARGAFLIPAGVIFFTPTNMITKYATNIAAFCGMQVAACIFGIFAQSIKWSYRLPPDFQLSIGTFQNVCTLNCTLIGRDRDRITGQRCSSESRRN